MKNYLLILPLIMLCFCSCNRLHEAQHVVAEADSLRCAGIMYDDSLHLADAVATLKPMRLFYPTDYAKANYYYGRLLRNRDNYVAAMQCFIDATESHTDNHEIMARSYSNMGSMCHLAGEYGLAYDMFEKSAENFINAEDTTAYYYALNKMAFELADQNKKDEALSILNQIENMCEDSAVISYTFGTKAELYLRTQQYDSTLYYSSMLLKQGNTEPYIIMLVAQAYSYLQNNDSALFYANIIMNSEGRYNDKYNALYILTHNDSTLNVSDALSLTSDREDIRHYKYEPRKGQLIQAVQILRQTIDEKPNYVLIVTLPIVAMITIIALTIVIIRVKKWRNRQIMETEKERQLYIELNNENKKQQETSERLKMEQQTITQTTQLLVQEQNTRQQRIYELIEKNADALSNSTDIKREIYWNDYEMMCNKINECFFSLITKLNRYNLSEQEVKLCILVLLKFEYDKIADLLSYSQSGIGKFKYRIAKKLGTTNSQMRDFLIKIAVEG